MAGIKGYGSGLGQTLDLGGFLNDKLQGLIHPAMAGPDYEKQRKDLVRELASNRRRAIKEGEKFGKKYFADKSLGRVDQGRSNEVRNLITQRKDQLDLAKKRSADVQRVIDMRSANLAGFTPDEINAMRAQEASQMGRAQSTALRQLRGVQAASGMRGGAAAAQQAGILGQAQAARANLERDLFLQNIAQKRAALGDYESSVRGIEGEEFGKRDAAIGGLENITTASRADELARQQYNQAQLGRERMGQASSAFGIAGLSAQEQAAAMQNILGEKQAAATVEAANAAGQGGKK
jgi:hypothetical protein